jgi:hypothetical protein
MPTIVHFEIPSDDIERSKRFYGELFGWKIDKWPSANTREGMEYWRITTVDDKGNDALTGGMMKRMMPEQQGITNYIDVKSVREYAAKVEQLGGKVFFPIMPVPGMGYFAMCADTEDNAFAIWQADQSAK